MLHASDFFTTHPVSPRFLRNADTLSCSLGNEEVVLDGTAQIYLGLNAVAALIWRSLSQPSTLAELTSKVTATFAVEPETATKDIANILLELESRSLVKRDDT